MQMKLSLVILIFQLAVLAMSCVIYRTIKRLHSPPAKSCPTLKCQAASPRTAMTLREEMLWLPGPLTVPSWEVTIPLKVLPVQNPQTRRIVLRAFSREAAIHHGLMIVELEQLKAPAGKTPCGAHRRCK